MVTTEIGEWLNGRATVSKTVGCGFESCLPCQLRTQSMIQFSVSAAVFFCVEVFFIRIDELLTGRKKRSRNQFLPGIVSEISLPSLNL